MCGWYVYDLSRCGAGSVRVISKLPLLLPALRSHLRARTARSCFTVSVSLTTHESRLTTLHSPLSGSVTLRFDHISNLTPPCICLSLCVTYSRSSHSAAPHCPLHSAHTRSTSSLPCPLISPSPQADAAHCASVEGQPDSLSTLFQSSSQCSDRRTFSLSLFFVLCDRCCRPWLRLKPAMAASTWSMQPRLDQRAACRTSSTRHRCGGYSSEAKVAWERSAQHSSASLTQHTARPAMPASLCLMIAGPPSLCAHRLPHRAHWPWLSPSSVSPFC